MKDVFVKDIQERDLVQGPFLVRDKIMAMAKNGKPYMTLKLVDKTGEVEGRVWDRVDEFGALFGKDDFIHVRGKASVYMGKMQLVIQDIKHLSDQMVDLSDFLPVSSRQTDEMLAEFSALIDTLRNPHLKALMNAFQRDEEFMTSYQIAPAAKAMHHVYLGGLMEHSLAVAHLADDIAPRYPDLDRDLLVTCALLHDIGKVVELRYTRTFDYTDEGKLLGHIVMGVEMVEDKCRTLPDFPRQLRVLIKHMLLSHHGQYEYGSPKRPKTVEAIVLNFLDDLDAKINGIRTHIEREPDNTNAWTSYHRLYDRYFFKNTAPAPDVSGPQAPEPAPAPAPQPKERKAAPPRSQKPKTAQKKGGFGFSLADQLKEKNLDLFSLDDNDKE